MLENDNLCPRFGLIARMSVLLAVVGVFASVDAVAATDYRSRTEYEKSDNTKNVLVLHSSHRGYGWTDSIMEGVESVIEKAPEKIELWVEYLDANRLQSRSFAQQLRLLYQSKYEKIKFDVVITSDRKALEFLLDNRKELADGVPVVFSTVGSLGTRLAIGHPKLTGVSESGDFRTTLDVAFTLHPNLESMVFISPGLRSRHLIESLVADSGPSWSFQSGTTSPLRRSSVRSAVCPTMRC
ncbi:MAG: hypothetical protein E4H01_09865 [Lysobacterales bacterium]|nr:MAG: hypothetical protein E4H01_09865 [Xanthomonadales bacterium]